MASLTAVGEGPRQPGVPEWIAPALQTKAGRDPLGLMTITQDRIMPSLVPGVLALTARARYFTFHPFLIDEFERRGLPPSNEVLAEFIKLREFELAYAVQLCPNGCGRSASGAVGTMAAQAVLSRNTGGEVARLESVESALGGYGLNYRAPLIDLGVVIPKGTPYGSGEEARPTPVDVLRRGEHAQQLAASYRAAIEETAYYRDWFVGEEPIPVEVLTEFAEHGCLCRLNEAPEEQQAIRELLFGTPAGEQLDFVVRDIDQRRRSFALFLRQVVRAPSVVGGDGSLHEAVWDDFAGTPETAGALAQTLLTTLTAAVAAIASTTASEPGSLCRKAISAEASRIDAGSASGTTRFRFGLRLGPRRGAPFSDQLVGERAGRIAPEQATEALRRRVAPRCLRLGVPRGSRHTRIVPACSVQSR